MEEPISSKLVTYGAFLITLGIVGVSIFSVIFPAFIISATYDFPHELEPFEISPWLLPISSSSVILFSFGYLFYKNKLPNVLTSKINFILSFDVSKKIALIFGIIILFIYIGLSIPELSIQEIHQWPDYLILKEALEIWPSSDHWSVYIKEQNTRYVRMILLDFSQDFLENIKLLPFIASISVVVLTGLITTQISKRRISGLIAMLILFQSITFTDFDTIAVYENFWVIFFLISIYVIQKKSWYTSPVSFLLAIFTKAFIVTYLWMNIFFIYRAEIPKKIKIILFASYGFITLISYLIFETGRSIIYDDIVRIDFNSFLDGFTGWGNAMQLDPLMILIILPLIFGLFYKSKNGLKQADSILLMIAGTILAGPLISLITDFYYILPYRFIPFIIFMAIGIGIIFSKKN